MERLNVTNLDDERLQKLLTDVLSIPIENFKAKLPDIPDQQIPAYRCVSAYKPTDDQHVKMQSDLIKYLCNNWIKAYRDQFNRHLLNYSEDYSPNVLKKHIARFAAGTAMELLDDPNLYDRYLQVGLSVIEQSFMSRIKEYAESAQIGPEEIDDSLALKLLDEITQEWITDSIYKIQLAYGLMTIKTVLNETKVKEDYKTNQSSYEFQDYYRQEYRTRTQSPTTESLEEYSEKHSDDPNLFVDGGFDNILTKESLIQALKSLSPIQQQIILAHYIERMPLVEIARQTKKDPSTISREKSLALKNLKNALESQNNN